MEKMKKDKVFVGNHIKLLKQYKNITSQILSNATIINIETLKNYEKSNNEPSIKNLYKLSNYFNISIDFFLLWDKCNYIRNIKLLALGEKLDKMGQAEHYQIESTIKSLLKDENEKEFEIKEDVINLDLKDNINDNLKIIFDKKDIVQKQIAIELKTKESVVSYYKTHINPPAEKLIKLSGIFDISIHALITGEKLNCYFKNESLKETLLRADKFLSLEKHKFLIQLMETIINNS